MYEGFKVVAVTPAGRKRYLELLCKLTHYNKNLIDEHHLWLNTDNREDISFIKSLTASNTFFKLKENPQGRTNRFDNNSICEFFPLACEKDTIYIRFDDDIVFIAPDAIENLLKARLKYLKAPLIFANIVNNAVCSHLWQRYGLIDTSKGVIGYGCMDGLGWGAPWFAVLLHNQFLEKGYQYFSVPNDWVLMGKEKVSINCICWFGKTLADVGIPVDIDEENWLSCELPKILTENNIIIGNAIVSHFAFHTQRRTMDNTQILEKYRQLSSHINPL